MAWLTGYSYRKKITITGQSGAGTDYQVSLSVGNSSGGDFHLEGHCTDFPNDIRVTSSDETTEIYYWIVDTSSDPIKIWIKVSEDLGTNKDIYIYYGKSGDTDGSDGDNTFLFFDDFPTTLDTGKWATTQGSVSTNTGKLELVGTSSTRGLLQGSTNMPIGSAFEVYALWSNSTQPNSHFLVGRKLNDWNNRIDLYGQIGSDSVSTRVTKNGSSSSSIDSLPLSTSVYRTYRFEWTSNRVAFYQDGSTIQTYTNTSTIPTDDCRMVFYEGNANGDITYIDWCFSKKFITTEPAFSSAGTEESGGPSGWIGIIGYVTNPTRIDNIDVANINKVGPVI